MLGVLRIVAFFDVRGDFVRPVMANREDRITILFVSALNPVDSQHTEVDIPYLD